MLRSALGTRRCSLDMVFGIHQTGPCSVKHVLEINIDNPYLLLMLRFVNNTLYCVKDVLKALKDQQAAVDEVEAAPAASCRQVPPPEPEQKPQAKKAKPGEAPLGFMMRLCIRKATVLVPHSSHSRESLALQLEQLLVGFPSAALVEQEMPAHCSQAGGLLGDSNAIEQCHLIGRPGEITRKGNRPAIDARLAARIQHFSLCTGVLAKVGGTAKVAASEVSEDISPDGAPAYKSTQAHMPNEQTHKRKQLEISVAGVRLLGPVPILHNVQVLLPPWYSHV